MNYVMVPQMRGDCGHPLTRRQISFGRDRECFVHVCDYCPRGGPTIDPEEYRRIMGRIQRSRPSYAAWKETFEVFGRKNLRCDAIISLGLGSVVNPQCGQVFPAVMSDPEETRRLAVRKGWNCSPEGDFCPSHTGREP